MSGWSSGAARERRPESPQDAQGALFVEDVPKERASSLQGLPERFWGRALAKLSDLRDPSDYFASRGRLELEPVRRGDGSTQIVGWYRHEDMECHEHVWEDTGLGDDRPDSPERWYARVAEPPKQEWLF